MFNLFEAEVRKWLDYFGLKDWMVEITQEEIEATAETRMHYVGRRAFIVFNTQLDEEDKAERNVRRTAFHEVCELMLSPLYWQAHRDGCSLQRSDDISRAGHDIIRRLENTIYKEKEEK